MPSTPPFAPFLHHDKNGNVIIDVHVVPNAAKTQAAGLYGESGKLALRLRLHAPPADGKANEALIRWLADCLKLAQSDLKLVRGETSRRKQLQLKAAAVEHADWAALLTAALPTEK